MNVLVFGKTGQVARELQKFDGVTALARSDANLSDPVACATIISNSNADAVINAAAYTAVDAAEEHEAKAQVINGDTPAAMAKATAAKGIPFVHISTDYVFDGNGSAPWKTLDKTNPQNAYGRTKLAGEAGVRAAAGVHAILRTSWVFSAHGANFVKTMLRLAEARDALTVVDDQIGGPTAAADIAKACMKMVAGLQVDPDKSGVYHFAGGPDVSWAEFAREIFAQAGKNVGVTGIPSVDYPTLATRPANSRMDCSELDNFGIDRPDWRVSLREVVNELEGHAK